MSDDSEDYRPSKVEMLASLVTGNMKVTSFMATVQRSHRFPLHLFAQIENMARMGGVPVSLVINQLLDVGIEAVMKEMTPEEADTILTRRNEQNDRPLVTERIYASGRRIRAKAKSAAQK